MSRPASFIQTDGKRSAFIIGESAPVDGFTTGDLWNGWDCPFFTLAQAERVIEVMNGYFYIPGHPEETCTLWYDPERDAIGEFDPHYAEEEDSGITYYGAREVSLPRLGLTKVYDIGSFVWVWQEVWKEEEA